MNDKLEEKLVEANRLREAEQYGESVKLYTECLIEQIDQKDYRGQVHTLCGQSLIYKILARKTSDAIYKRLTVALTKEAIGVLDLHIDMVDQHTQSIAYSSFADGLLMDNQIKESLPYFEKSLAISPAEIPEKGRLKAHIGDVKYLLGEKQIGKDLINEALTDIRSGDMNSYPIRVWETGALNALAKIYAIEGETQKAKDTIMESLKIATDHALTIRKKEAEEIEKKISSGDTNFSI